MQPPAINSNVNTQNSPQWHFTVKSKRAAGQTGKLVRRSRRVREHKFLKLSPSNSTQNPGWKGPPTQSPPSSAQELEHLLVANMPYLESKVEVTI